MSLRDAWESQAENWTRWAREPGHDSYWRFHRDRFLETLPEPGRLTLDVGCGEGRLTRDLAALGHQVIGVDASPTMLESARQGHPALDFRLADGAALPFDEGAADLVAAFMSLHDMDDMPGSVREAHRVLRAGGRFCVAVVHPINSAGSFEGESDDSPFVIRESYFDRRLYSDAIERDGLAMTFHSRHWTLEDYSRALEEAGFQIELLREIAQDDHPRWRRAPLFLHLRALKG